MFFYGGFGTTWEYLLQYPKELNMVGHMITLMFKRRNISSPTTVLFIASITSKINKY